MNTETSIDSDMIQALLHSARIRPTRVEKPGEITPFDFHVPHRFGPEQARRLRDVAEILARNLTATLSAALQGAFPLTLNEWKEWYVDRQPKPERAYYVPLNMSGRLAGHLLLPRDTAIGWVTTLLGGSAEGEVEEDRTLSSLEHDLLLDITKKVVATISRVSRDNAGPEITHTPSVSHDPPELVEEGQIADVCHFTYQRKEGEKALPFTLVFLSELLESIAGVVRPAERSTDEIYQDMLSHVESVPMDVNVRLGTVSVSMRDLVSVEAGDVILLPNSIEDPIDVMVSGKTIMSGQPVQHKGWYGLQIHQVQEEA
ncbi:MAG: FliM/FliN family flagellar motor switch protein [Phycisphaerae bacterium]|nr:FliM/FliN family flagellar motor switch protein [Phycisphaerae bacterium]